MFCNTFAVGNMPKLPHNVDVVPRGIREKMTHCCHYESRHEGAYSPNIVCHPLSVCLLPFLFHVSNRFAIHSRKAPDFSFLKESRNVHKGRSYIVRFFNPFPSQKYPSQSVHKVSFLRLLLMKPSADMTQVSFMVSPIGGGLRPYPYPWEV